MFDDGRHRVTRTLTQFASHWPNRRPRGPCLPVSTRSPKSETGCASLQCVSVCVWEREKERTGERKSVWDGLRWRKEESEREREWSHRRQSPPRIYKRIGCIYVYIWCAFTRAYYNYIKNTYIYIYVCVLVVTPICNRRISISSSSSSSFKRDLSIPTWWCLPPQPRKLSRCVISHSNIKLLRLT